MCHYCTSTTMKKDVVKAFIPLNTHYLMIHIHFTHAAIKQGHTE